MDRKKLGLWAPIFVLAAALVMLAVSTGDVDAARGGKPGGGGGGGKPGGGSTATLTVTPNQVPLGAASVTISGSGFASNQGLVINTSMFPQPWITTGESGSFSIVYSPSGTFWAAGTAYVQALNSSTMAVLATASYTVCSTNPC
jgi:hypothetical protein